MNFKAVLFDFDYTLGDATESIVAGFTHGFTQMGLEVPSIPVIRGTVGMMLEDAYTGITGDSDPASQAEFRRLFVEVGHAMQMEGVPLFPGAKDLILALHEHGIATGVVSSKRCDSLTSILTKHGLGDVLSLIIGGDTVTNPKPHPEGLLTAAATLGLEPSEILYCGDTVIDAEAALQAKIPFCPVLNGVTPVDAFSVYPWVHVAQNLFALRKFLQV